MEEKRVCDVCGREYPQSELMSFRDLILCGECLRTETTVCSCCGERIWTDDNEGDGDTPLCGRCYERSYTTCTDCGRTIHQDDAYYIDEVSGEARCYSCFCSQSRERVIHDYYYKPEPFFYGEGKRHFGVELEIDGAGESNANAAKLVEVANHDRELVYIKHDGSLDDGMEIVTHPMSLDFHFNQMPWAALLDKAKAMGYRSHLANTCGLHIHVNRTAFGETEEEQEAVIGRILYFFEKHWGELLRFSRRTQRQIEHWADRYGLREQPKQVLVEAKGRQERYTCVNLTITTLLNFECFGELSN